MAKAKTKSQYDKYPLPFFNKRKRLTWDATPSGDMQADSERGREYARQFLASCDFTYGWNSLLGQIVLDIVRMGPQVRWKDGSVSCGPVVLGFFGELSRALVLGELPKRGLRLATPQERREAFQVIEGRGQNPA